MEAYRLTTCHAKQGWMFPAPCITSWCEGSINQPSSMTIKPGAGSWSASGRRSPRRGLLVYAWAFMDTPHILFKSGQDGISAVMRRLLTWYAQYYNRRHRRTGHLFESRYKSILCDEGSYLLSLIRYIHLNPVRAGIITNITELNSYPWSGHSTIMEKNQHDWMDSAYVLAQFSHRKKAAKAPTAPLSQKEWPREEYQN